MEYRVVKEVCGYDGHFTFKYKYRPQKRHKFSPIWVNMRSKRELISSIKGRNYQVTYDRLKEATTDIKRYKMFKSDNGALKAIKYIERDIVVWP